MSQLKLSGDASGTGIVTVAAPNTNSTYTVTLPAAAGTLARTDAAQTFTGTQTFSSNPVLSGGTANGVLYLNGSKVATSGSALTFDGTTFTVGASASARMSFDTSLLTVTRPINYQFRAAYDASNYMDVGYFGTNTVAPSNPFQVWYLNSSEGMRLTSTGLGIGGGGAPATGCTLDVQSTSAFKMPVGTTAQRPTGVTGMQRFNTTTGFVEYYNGGSWVSPAYNGTTKAIFGYGYTTGSVSMTNLVSNVGVVASDVTGVGTARYGLAAASYGGDKAIFGYGTTGSTVSVTNLVSNAGVVATDTTGVGTARAFLAAAGYGGDKAIFGYGFTGSTVSMTNLVSNAGVVATDTTGVGTARYSLAATSYGGDKAIFGYGTTGSGTAVTNLVSNAGVVATNTTGVGTARFDLAAASYGGDKAIFGYGYATVDVSITNLVSNTGVVATDTTGAGTARNSLVAAGYGTDKAIFGYGYTVSNVSVTNLLSNTGVVSADVTGVGTARRLLAAAGYAS